MDFSAANTSLWGIIVQLGIIAGVLLAANALRRKIPFIRKSLMPVAVLAGFMMLLLRVVGIVPINTTILEMLTYHGIALGFIALSLRIPSKAEGEAGRLVGPKSGALIVSSYLVQGIAGLLVSLALAYTAMPGLFKASGILLPMGFGQGPGQANNIGTTYESLGFVGGRSFGLSIAAAGYLVACTVGVVYINVVNRRHPIRRQGGEEISGSVTVETFQDEGEIGITESVDKLSMQMAQILLVYLAAYLLIRGLSALGALVAPGAVDTIATLLWGFNFIVGSMLALLLRTLFIHMRKANVITRQYQNNYLLSRLSGLFFDVMIVAGIASIDISDLSGLWLPFILMVVVGTAVTLLFLQWACKRLYPGYYYEGFLSMFGMMTGTISSGVLLLREVDPDLKTPASNNMVTGSSAAILFGAPMLALIGIAPNNTATTWVVLGLLVVYLAALQAFMLLAGRGKKKNK